MPAQTSISWSTASHNFWSGCQKLSQGCKNCYAARIIEGKGGIFSEYRLAPKARFEQPLKWSPRTIFVTSMSDFFWEAADADRDWAWSVIRATPQHDWLILSKRLERTITHNLFPPDWGEGWEHVWIGTSIENKETIFRASLLKSKIPARHKFVSAEPLLGPIGDLWKYLGDDAGRSIEWVITGGESGHNARPMKAEWVEDIHEQADQTGAIHFHKQNGGFDKIDDEFGGYKVDGNSYRELPDFPSGHYEPPRQLELF